MNVQIVGTMLDPSGGEPAGGAMIQFIALAQYGGVPKGAQSTQTTSATGEYDFPLNYGRYTLAINHSGRFVNQAVSVTVNEDSPSVMDIDLLLESSVPLTPPEIKYVEELVEQAEQAALSSSNSASQAGVEVISATNQANIATNEADRAKSEADRAAEVTGLDTVEQAVDMALGEFAGITTESEARAINRINKAKYDASGFVNTGKQFDGSGGAVINEGVWVYPDAAYPNTIWLGREGGGGTSKTDYPVTHIAGAVSNILGTGIASAPSRNLFHLPPAEDGARIYDSTGDTRGSGQESLDLKVDIDPKYGDIPTGTEAQILREGVDRAFEGYCVNGDFRLGNNGDWFLTGSAVVEVGEATVPNSSSIWRTSPIAYVDGVTYTVEVVANSVVGNPLFRHTTARNDIVLVDGLNKFSFTFNSSSDVNPRYQVLTTASDSCKVTSVSVKSVTEEVVTHPVDLVGFEYYEEELTGTQEVFECIQSLSTTFGDTDVPTVLSTRKLSYFQQYDGQFPEVTANPDFINDRYRCVVWNDLTEPQKREVAAYMGEKLFMGVNGFPVNGRLRARTIRGAGNGDWYGVDPASTATTVLMFGDKSRVRPQGTTDYQASLSASSGLLNTSTETNDDARGAWKYHPQFSSYAYQGRGYVYIVATVPRANKAAYVEGLNELGTGMLQSKRGAGFSEVWYASNAVEVNTLQDTFTMVAPNTGAIGQLSGHPEGLFYDGIEAGGLNGVIDWRLGAVANDSPEEAAKVEAKVENKTYRGLEKSVWTFVGTSTEVGLATGAILDGGIPKVGLTEGSSIFIETSVGNYEERTVTGLNYSLGAVNFTPAAARITGGHYIVSGTINLSVSGKFNTKMVIADPVNFLKVFPDGIEGTWCPVIPDGAVDDFELTRKALNTPTFLRTTNFGSSWNSASPAFNPTTNSAALTNEAAANVLIVNYKAWAKPTKKSTNKPVLNAKAGLLGVTVTQSYDKSVLAEAVSGVILKSDASGIVTEQSNPVKFLVNEVIERITSLTTDMVSPTNNSQAIKIAIYQISENGQVSLGFIANTMTHNGTDWGELDEIIIPFGDLEVDTFNDANGILQTAQSTMTAIPHGWTSNHARAGEQVPGVDL